MAITSPVTLQLRDIDVKSVFRMMADTQRLNLLLDPSVPDITIPSIIFNGVPFNEAFAYLLRMSDLSYSLSGNTLVVGTAPSLGKTLGKEVRRAYNLSYAVDDGGNLTSDLTAALTGLVPLSQPPVIDARNRTLYVTATEEQHEEVAALLTKLDQPGQQIMLQARIVQVNDGARQDLEQVISAVYDQWLVNFSGGGTRVGFNRGNGVFPGADLGIPIGGTAGENSVNLTNVVLDAGQKVLMAGLTALEDSNKGKVLANPSVITLDGKEARISLTRNMKYASGIDSNGNTTFSDVEIGPQLSFTPVIGRNGWVTIKIRIETGEVVAMRQSGYGSETPETTSREVETMVRVRNGEPFAVGGLFEDRKTSSRARIPVLGNIPLLGDLFTTRHESHDKSEVAMIVIPYILNVPDDGIETYDLQESSLSTR
jgi:type IV pilus assembly protein PilQ